MLVVRMNAERMKPILGDPGRRLMVWADAKWVWMRSDEVRDLVGTDRGRGRSGRTTDLTVAGHDLRLRDEIENCR